MRRVTIRLRNSGRSTIAQTHPASRRRSSRSVSLREIQAVADQIVARFHPQRVILFGSHARGDAGPDSDVDLLVVTDRPAGRDESLRMRLAINYPFALDLIVCDAARLRRRMSQGDFFLIEAVEQGKVLYDRPGPGMVR